MSYFFDSNALVKRYYDEPGSWWVRAVCSIRARPAIFISVVAEVEVVAAIRRATRLAGQHSSYADAVTNQFLRDLALSNPQHQQQEYDLVELLPTTRQLAQQLCVLYWRSQPGPLRSLDAIQLASAKVAQAISREEVSFVTSDQRLKAIAESEGFEVIDPEAGAPVITP